MIELVGGSVVAAASGHRGLADDSDRPSPPAPFEHVISCFISP